jgi:D-3-phosphoglycerate dehydrogenase
VKLHTDRGERWVEGTTFEHGGPRLVLLDGVPVEAPLDGTLVVMRNNDLPGVIGEVGTVLGRHRLNIANFALGRDANGAVGVVNVDERTSDEVNETIVGEIERVPAIRDVWVVRV